MLKVGVDVGGTFTDCYATDGKNVRVGKSLTTPDDLSVGIINSIESGGVEIKDIDILVHGSTIATNALITRNYYGWWPKTMYVTSEGFRDTLEIRRGRNQLYGEVNMYGTAPDSLIKRNHRFTLREKVDADGILQERLNPVEIEQLITDFKKIEPDSIAIVFINSFLNSENELAAKKALEKAFPNIPICTSAEVAPKFRELGRMVTVTVRALLYPIITDYMNKVEKAFDEKHFKGELLMVKGDGGTCNVDFIKTHPEMLIGSGPAAGAFAGQSIGKLLGVDNLLTQDTGGTSYDVGVIEEGRSLRTMEYEIDLDMPFVLPMTDVRSIGTGGGSIIWIDTGGSLRVGPQSAGAKPGPICYGLNGTNPTITDANLLLGRIDRSLGGKIELDIDNAKKYLKEKVSEPLGRDVYEIAESAINIACINMARANSLITTSRGRDPRNYVPVLFGGAGGLHACKVSDELGVKKAIIIPYAGVASAMGATMMPFSTYAEKTLYTELDNADLDRLNSAFSELKEKVVSELVVQGVDTEEISTHKELHMRYIGQNYEVMIQDMIDEDYDIKRLDQLKKEFNEAHLKERGINETKFPVAIVDIRVMGSSSHQLNKLPTYAKTNQDLSSALKMTRPVYFDGCFIDTPVYDSTKLGFGHLINGPAVIEMPDSCLVIMKNWKGSFDQYKNILLERK